MRVTLEQLRIRREKRRRRLSESESDTTYSDVSSDSGSVVSQCRGFPSETASMYLRSLKKYKSDRNENSYFVQSTSDNTTTNDMSKTSLPCVSSSEVETLTPDEIYTIEHITRSTWDGHECNDPKTAPPVAPITSCMYINLFC